MPDLKELENNSIYIIREAYAEFKKPAVLWSTGKDSSAVLWLCRKAFFGKIPFPVIHIDTGYKFKEMYEFRDMIAKEWGMNLIVAQNQTAVKEGVGPKTGKLDCCTSLKTEALKMCVEKYSFDALLLAIRRDEHGIRAKERVFSPRNQSFQWDYRNQPLEMWDKYQSTIEEGFHTRVHPILQWRELDIWEYVMEEGIPVNPLYFSQNGKRYRSLGCEPCTSTINSDAKTIPEIVNELKTTKIAERSGRAQDKEKSFMMQKLRALGYM
ncbi:MAG: sulfate adenylyltransferase subunit 2 [Thaumarchaeota archaeon]|nr:sulfate adenylyltransferase subunit 2 [Nitrososphaerota archaeon]MCL5318587.1 sulfate adenylyltransferase subunit 2 [Nitrososphaerota archaeon]